MIQKYPLVLFVLFIVFATRSQGESMTPFAYSDLEEVLISGKSYVYYSFSRKRPLELKVSGPGELTVITRWLFPMDYQGEQEYTITVLTDSDREDTYLFTSKPSSQAELKSSIDVRPGLPKKMVFDVPEGKHTYFFLAEAPEGKKVLASFHVTKPWSWDWKASVTNTYDDNVYRYSPEDIDNFVNHREDEHFSMKTYDDLIVSPSLTVNVTRRFSESLQSRLRLNYRYNLFTQNGERNYQTFSLSLKTTAFKTQYLQLDYFRIPSFLIRPYWDEDAPPLGSEKSEKYRACDFTRNLYSVKIGRRVWRSTWVSAFYERDLLYYNRYFTEYDTKANTFGFELGHAFTPRVEMTVEYAFRKAEAKGYDEPGETKALSDDSDISYDEDQLLGKVAYDVSRHVLLPVDVTFQYRLNKRYFTTKKTLEQDPFHAGRKDTIHRFSLKTDLGVYRNLTIFGLYEYHWRDVSSKEKERITEVKNYHRNRISAGFELAY